MMHIARLLCVATLATLASACDVDPVTGCCVDVGGCPPCCLYSVLSWSSEYGTTCVCQGCEDDLHVVDAACTAQACNDTLIDMLGCTACIGEQQTCYPTQTSREACAAFSPCAGGGGDDPCFPAYATLATGKDDGNTTTTPMADYDPSQPLRTASLAGEIGTSPGSSLRFSIAQPEATGRFVRLVTASGHNLTVTPRHHVATGAACCDTLTRASDVRPGDTLWIGDHPHHLVPKPTVVVHRAFPVHARGLYSPVPLDGRLPIVDGVVTAFDSYAVSLLAAWTGGVALLS